MSERKSQKLREHPKTYALETVGELGEAVTVETKQKWLIRGDLALRRSLNELEAILQASGCFVWEDTSSDV